MGVLVANRKGTGRRGGDHIHIVPVDRRTDRREIVLGLPFGLIVKSVRDERHTAALLLIQQTDTIPRRIHDPDQVLTELRIVIVHVASMEIGDLLGENYDRFMSWEILAAARGNEFAIEKLQFLFNTAFDAILNDENYDEICYKNDIDDTNELYKLGKNICKMLVRELSLFPVDLAGAKDETVKYTQERFIYYRKKIDEIVEPTIKFLLS